MLVQFATMPGRDDRPNEDFVGAFGDCAVLLDGSGGPSELPSGCKHGTPWFVRQLGARLLAGMETEPSAFLPNILSEAIAEVAGLHGKTCDLDAPGTPAAIVVMARAAGDWFEWLVLGDSTIVMDAGGKVTAISDRRIDDVARAEREAMEALPVGTPEHQAARIRFVNLQRQLRNTADGYWIASADPEAAREALTGRIPLADVRRVALVSDGVSRFVEFDLGSWAEMLGLLDVWGPPSLIARIREAEGADPAGRRWPRAKSRDDVAVVHFSARERDADGYLVVPPRLLQSA